MPESPYTFDRPTLEKAFERLGGPEGIANASDAIALVMRYYPAGQISPKTRFGLEEIFGQDEG